MRDFLNPDAITIDGVTITREQYELVHARLGTWESFVAAHTKPEHYDGEPCTLPVIFVDSELAEGLQFEYTGRKTNNGGNRTWLVINGEIMYGYDDKGWYWELRAVPIKPAPKYDVGMWVVPLDGGNPIQIVDDFCGYDIYGKPVYVFTCNDNKEYSETSKIATLRPAIREDFMVTFSGVKVWMEKHDDERMREYFDGNSGSCFRWIDEWQITRNRAAGIMEMPKEFWI